jgi:PEGA domain-containing protein
MRFSGGLAIVFVTGFLPLAAADTGPGKAAKTDGGDETAALRLRTQPSGAEVRLGDRTLGKTPLACQDLRPGLCTLTATKDGFVPLAIQVYLTPQTTVNLGTVPLAKKDSLITIWRVGSPHDGNVPQAMLPADLDAFIKGRGFRTRIQSFSNKEFAVAFRKVFAEVGGANVPDVIAGDNFLPFQDLLAEPRVKPSLLRVSGVLQMLDPFVFLVSRSSSHAAARTVALTNQGMAMPMSFSWSLQERGLKDLPGQMRSKTDRKVLEERTYRATSAYLLGSLEGLSLRNNDMLAQKRAFDSQMEKVAIAGMRPLYVLGNSRIAFVLATASFWSEERLGCMGVLSVWIKTGGSWSLLTITNDPVSLEAATKDFPQLAGALAQEKGAAVQPAKLLTPGNMVFPTPMAGRFGDFRWIPSPSQELLAEIGEFHYGWASRLFYQPGGKVSTGQLWTTGGPWSWRVWSISKDGQVTWSEVRQFRD